MSFHSPCIIFFFLIHLRDDIMITGVCKESVSVSVCQDWCLRCWYWKAIKQQVCLCLSLEVVISFRRSALAQQSSLKLLQCVPTRNAHILLPARNESKKSFLNHLKKCKSLFIVKISEFLSLNDGRFYKVCRFNSADALTQTTAMREHRWFALWQGFHSCGHHLF